MFLLRGFEFTHEAVREWEERFAPLLAEQLRCKRKGNAGRRWYVDEIEEVLELKVGPEYFQYLRYKMQRAASTR